MDGSTLVVHGHFYQPPRENPWTETVDAEPSSAPYHDWNERITAESYRPNGWARIVDDHEGVVAVVDNYAHLSFNVGPTLAAWLALHEPGVLARMVDGDRVGGGAIAQAYNHMILPLASIRDARTQVRWGLADFEHRFGRRAEGIWLPETAVNDDVLRVLAEEGVGFTILAPDQASSVRPPGGDDENDENDGDPAGWTDVGPGEVDVSHPYRWVDPDDGDRGVDLVFYDGPLSHEVAFGLGSLTAETMVGGAAARVGLTCIAADGETFGHHHRFTERKLAYALPVVAPRMGVPVAALGPHLRASPPTWQARVHESSWSCAHGVERWRRDCGCSTGGPPQGADQAWRGPLRQALDRLRDRGVEVFERRGPAVLRQPWAARDAYIDVLLGRRSLSEFAAEHVVGDLTEARTLLEQQRHALLMYTSCAWFFWDLAGLETVQCLRYAARAMDLLEELGEPAGLDEFLAVLGEARSNEADEGDGRDVWHRHVVPARVGPERAVAHLAMLDALLTGHPAPEVAAWSVEVVERGEAERDGLRVAVAVVELVHRRTGHRSRHAYAALRRGPLDVVGGVEPAEGPEADDLATVLSAFEEGRPVGEVAELIRSRFGATPIDLGHVLPDAAARLAADLSSSLAHRLEAGQAALDVAVEAEVDALLATGQELPAPVRSVAERSLLRHLTAEIRALVDHLDRPEPRVEAVLTRFRQARGRGLDLDVAAAGRVLAEALDVAVDRAATEYGRIGLALAVLAVAEGLGVELDLSRAQERVYDLLVTDARTRPQADLDALRRLGPAVGLSPGPLGIPS
ncbi:MAG TPA: DUF3536 domain-containing protein [Acidimicrobiales bacterium]